MSIHPPLPVPFLTPGMQVEDALKNKEVHRVGVAAAAAVAPSSLAPNSATPAAPFICAFCGKPGHTVERCFKFEDASKKAKEEVSSSSKIGVLSARVRLMLPKKRRLLLSLQEQQVFISLALPAPSLMPGMQTLGSLLI